MNIKENIISVTRVAVDEKLCYVVKMFGNTFYRNSLAEVFELMNNASTEVHNG